MRQPGYFKAESVAVKPGSVSDAGDIGAHGIRLVLELFQLDFHHIAHADDAAQRAPFLAAGYHEVRDWLVHGPIVTEQFSPRELDGYLLWRQRIHPQRRFTDARQAFREMGGIRSEFELSLRIQGRFFHPRDYGEEFDLVLGVMIPGYATYSTVRDAMVYRDARDRTVR